MQVLGGVMGCYMTPRAGQECTGLRALEMGSEKAEGRKYGE